MKSCLVGVKKERKENGSRGGSLGPTIFCHCILGRKGKGQWYGKNNYKITFQFLIILIYNKDITILYFLSLHFSIFPTKHICGKSFLFPYFSIFQIFVIFPCFYPPKSQRNIDSRLNLSNFCFYRNKKLDLPNFHFILL